MRNTAFSPKKKCPPFGHNFLAGTAKRNHRSQMSQTQVLWVSNTPKEGIFVDKKTRRVPLKVDCRCTSAALDRLGCGHLPVSVVCTVVSRVTTMRCATLPHAYWTCTYLKSLIPAHDKPQNPIFKQVFDVYTQCTHIWSS